MLNPPVTFQTRTIIKQSALESVLEGAHLASLLSNVGCVQDAAEHVGDMHQRHYLCLWTEQLCKGLCIKGLHQRITISCQ